MKRQPAAGSFRRDDKEHLHPQIVVRLDRETFDQVRELAARENVSFSQKARDLIEWGLEVERQNS